MDFSENYQIKIGQIEILEHKSLMHLAEQPCERVVCRMLAILAWMRYTISVLIARCSR